MVRLIGLIISITVQLAAALFALRLIKITKYRLSWIFIAFGFAFMALRRGVDLIEFYTGEITYEMTLFYDLMGLFIAFLSLGGVLLIREIFYSLKKAEIDRIRSERQVINAILQTEEKERMRFAKDLHDGLGPLLSTVKMAISALLKKITQKNENAILSNTDKVVDEAISSIKEISNNISPHILTNFGLSSAINNFANKVNATKKVKIEFTTNLDKERINRNVEIVIYRAVCELINNTMKHAKATNIDISLNQFDNLLTLHYNDNGQGFNVEEILNSPESGMGYSNIKSRINSIDGVFILESTKDTGTHALINVNI